MTILHMRDLAEGSVIRGLLPTSVKKLIFITAACTLYTTITGNKINLEYVNETQQLADDIKAFQLPARIATLMFPTSYGYTRFDVKEIVSTAPKWIQYATQTTMENDLKEAIASQKKSL